MNVAYRRMQKNKKKTLFMLVTDLLQLRTNNTIGLPV